jgi:hypothetical protein
VNGLRALVASACLAAVGAAAGVPSATPAVRDAPDADAHVARAVAPPLSVPDPVVPRPQPSRTPPKVVERGTGRLHVVAGTSARSGSGPRYRYLVLVEGGLGLDAVAFAQAVERVLADPRSWGAAGRRSFQRVDHGDVDLRVVLASPRTTDDLCAPMTTEGRLSCADGTRAVVNARRWLTGAPSYRGHLAEYRAYVVNHEVGHVLGKSHADCPGRGEPAPVMMQQTLGVGACRPSPWPFP